MDWLSRLSVLPAVGLIYAAPSASLWSAVDFIFPQERTEELSAIELEHCSAVLEVVSMSFDFAGTALISQFNGLSLESRCVVRAGGSFLLVL
jgi:hypothetical protein